MCAALHLFFYPFHLLLKEKLETVLKIVDHAQGQGVDLV
jgi:hypothetical protein